MKVFLVSAPKGEKELGHMFLKLYDEVKNLGYVHTSDIMTVSAEDFSVRMSKGKEAMVEFYNEMMRCIQQADICIFEATTPSFGVGYLIDKSLSYAKPTVILFYKEQHSFLLPGIDDDKLLVRVYDEKNYKRVLKEVLDVARERRDKRFNFFLSPKLLEYLEDASSKEGVTKSKLIRDMIVEHMRSQPNEDNFSK